MDDLIPWGVPIDDQRPEALGSDRARRLAAACSAHPAFEIIEYRRVERTSHGVCDVVVVRCANHEVPNRNPAGIRVRETLALTVPIDDRHAPEVRALRVAFPVVPHLNMVNEGEPKALCLFIETWSAARHTWTPQRFLGMILWWLRESALGTLHLPQQPVERIYYDLGYELVLPAEYRAFVRRNLRLGVFRVARKDRWTFIALDAARFSDNGREYVPVHLQLERAHGGVEWLPFTLGALADQWAAHGVPLGQKVVEQLRELAGGGVMEVEHQAVVLILDIGVTREPGGRVERHDLTAFLIHRSVVSLAYTMNAVIRQNFMYFAPSEPSPTAADDTAKDWRAIEIMPLDVKLALTPAVARGLAGIDDEAGDAERVLIGVGALGSALADIWAREGWGRWTYVDPDHVQPHNLVRHRAVYGELGRYKVDALKTLIDTLYPTTESRCVALPVSATMDGSAELTASLGAASLVVDVSTTLDVPRELSQRPEARRMVSAFITPDGGASVLLFEDQERSVPLDCIEAQYYRQILRSDWGATHLAGHLGSIAVGAGCRDVSVIMSPETVELHAGILARQVRVASAGPDGGIRVWSSDANSAVTLHSAALSPAYRLSSDKWSVVLDDAIIETMQCLRAEKLPKETGGIIAGYVDHVSHTIYVVDALPAPADSVEEHAGFVRGAEGLPAQWRELQHKTAMIVNYVGEWHSHPPSHGATPSWHDLTLIGTLGVVLASDGDPALMLIIGDNELGVFVCDSDGSTAEVSGARLIRWPK